VFVAQKTLDWKKKTLSVAGPSNIVMTTRLKGCLDLMAKV
jgi:hypothetical protein